MEIKVQLEKVFYEDDIIELLMKNMISPELHDLIIDLVSNIDDIELTKTLIDNLESLLIVMEHNKKYAQ